MRDDQSGHSVDPRLTELILKLHARSAQLAVSNALDDVLVGPESERQLKLACFYERLGEELATARSLLNFVQVEPADQFRELLPADRMEQSLTEFLTRILEDQGQAYLSRLLPKAHAIMRSGEDAIAKRRLFLDMVRRFHDEEFIVRSKGLIKSAFLKN